MPTNRAAYEMLHPDMSQSNELNEAIRWIEKRMAQLSNDDERQMLLQIYANPVVAKQQINLS